MVRSRVYVSVRTLERKRFRLSTPKYMYVWRVHGMRWSWAQKIKGQGHRVIKCAWVCRSIRLHICHAARCACRVSK